jgi:Glycosyltransferase sugar-binding region containing DXD motif
VSAAGPAIVQYWDSETVPAEVAALLETFEEPEAEAELPHLVFDERGATAFLAERFGPRHTAAFAACAVPAMQADYFRYCVVHALGGVYVDADFRRLAPLGNLLEATHTGTLFGRHELPAHWRTPAFEWRERIGPYRVVMNSFFAFPSPGHPLLELAIEIATANVEARVGEDVALVTGPAVFTSLYLLRELGSFDAFVDYARGGVLEPFSQLFCTTVSDHDRVVRAFEGVRLLSEEESRSWVRGADEPLSYKQSEDHWPNVTSSIYR